MNQAQQEVQPIPQGEACEIVSVEDLDSFVRHLTAWHSEQCAIVQHLLTIPEGSTFEVDDATLVLDGPTLDGFKFGIEMAMMQFGELPFVAEFEEEQEAALDAAS